MDGTDHRDISMRHLRKQVALVGQEPVLFEVHVCSIERSKIKDQK